MAATQDSKLIEAAERLLASAKQFKGDVPTRQSMLNQMDSLRYMIESPVDTIWRQWYTVRLCRPIGFQRLLTLFSLTSPHL